MIIKTINLFWDYTIQTTTIRIYLIWVEGVDEPTDFIKIQKRNTETRL